MTNPLTHEELARYTGTECYYRHAMIRTITYTDGAKAVADKGGAYWLLDIIAIPQRGNRLVAAELFQVWTLTVADSKASLICEDGFDNTIYRQDIPLTDFPLPSLTFYAGSSQKTENKGC